MQIKHDGSSEWFRFNQVVQRQRQLCAMFMLLLGTEALLTISSRLQLDNKLVSK